MSASLFKKLQNFYKKLGKSINLQYICTIIKRKTKRDNKKLIYSIMKNVNVNIVVMPQPQMDQDRQTFQTNYVLMSH